MITSVPRQRERVWRPPKKRIAWRPPRGKPFDALGPPGQRDALLRQSILSRTRDGPRPRYHRLCIPSAWKGG